MSLYQVLRRADPHVPGVPRTRSPRGGLLPCRQRGGARRLLGVSLALACLAAAPASARDDRAGAVLELRLEEAIFAALKNSRAAIGARLGRDEQALSLEAAEERYRPSASAGVHVSGGVSGGMERERTTDISVGPSLRVPTGGSFRLSWSRPVEGSGDRAPTMALTFTQPLLKGFGTDIDTVPLRRARMRERINLRAFRDTAAGLIGSVISAYRNMLSTRRRVVIAREALERARRQLEINRTMVQAGRMAPQDLVQTESEVANREYGLVDAENGLETAISGLVDVLDLDEDVRIEPVEEPDVVPERPDLETSVATAFARRTDWLRAELGLELARMDLRIAENDLLPDLSLDVRVSRRDDGVGEIDYSWGLNLAVPLWDDSPDRALATARNDLRRAEMALAEARQSIRIQVRRTVHNVNVALRQIDIAGEARVLARRKLEIERLKFDQGLSSAFQLSRFEDDLVNAQRRELDAVVRYRNSLTSLDRTLGTTLDRWGITVEQVGR